MVLRTILNEICCKLILALAWFIILRQKLYLALPGNSFDVYCMVIALFDVTKLNINLIDYLTVSGKLTK